MVVPNKPDQSCGLIQRESGRKDSVGSKLSLILGEPNQTIRMTTGNTLDWTTHRLGVALPPRPKLLGPNKLFFFPVALTPQKGCRRAQECSEFCWVAFLCKQTPNFHCARIMWGRNHARHAGIAGRHWQTLPVIRQQRLLFYYQYWRAYENCSTALQ